MNDCNELLEERGQIVQVEGDYAWIEVARKPGCSSCATRSECGTAVLAKAMSSKPVLIKAVNMIAADVGDEVVVGIEQKALMAGSFSVYAAPLLLMLFAALLGDFFGQKFYVEYHNVISMAFALLGLLLGFFWLKNYSKKASHNESYQPSLIRLVSS